MRSLMILRWMQDRAAGGYGELIPMVLQVALGQAAELEL